MALAKRLRDTAEKKRNEQLPLLESIDSIQNHIADFTTADGACPSVSIDMCVVSVVAFEKGWRCMLTDKDTAQGDFAAFQADIDILSYRELSEFIFQLTLWRGKKYPDRKPAYKSGTTLFVKRVSDLKTYHGHCQGTAEIDDMLKTEDEERVAKKPKNRK